MKLKVPFINFKNYVVLKCYSTNALVYEAFPVQLSARTPNIKRASNKNETPYGFRTCYGRTGTLKTSATLPWWVETDIIVKNGKVSVERLENNPNLTSIDWGMNNDPYIGQGKLDQMVIMKHNTPWWFEEDTGVQFLYAPNIHNTTRLHTPSGIANFKYQHGVSVFNYIHVASDHRYTIPAGEPVASFYPLTDKKLYVESYYDPAKTQYLIEKATTRPFWGNHLSRVTKQIQSNEK